MRDREQATERAPTSREEVEAHLHAIIPLSAAMGVRVRACDAAGATLSAPLAPNINHRATVFGGSASAVAILAAWTWLHVALRSRGLLAGVVIQKNAMHYLAPITGDFTARCVAPEAAKFERFLRTLHRHGRARLALEATLEQEGQPVGRFSGDYVAIAGGAGQALLAAPGAV